MCMCMKIIQEFPCMCPVKYFFIHLCVPWSDQSEASSPSRRPHMGQELRFDWETASKGRMVSQFFPSMDIQGFILVLHNSQHISTSSIIWHSWPKNFMKNSTKNILFTGSERSKNIRIWEQAGQSPCSSLRVSCHWMPDNRSVVLNLTNSTVDFKPAVVMDSVFKNTLPVSWSSL